MKAERYKQIDELFQAVLERPPEDRAAFLVRVCADDPELRCEVEALLAADHEVRSFIESPAFELAPGLLADGRPVSLIGGAIGPYRVTARLGSGGMGEVYLAEDSRLGRHVALKLLSHSFVGDIRSRERFLREARLASILDHPNICTIYEVGEANGNCFIAMQYVEGKTLKDLIAGQPLTLDRLLMISLQVADALAAAHRQGIIHRDIKSSNMIIRPHGQVKVLDFGLAKVLGKENSAKEEELTRAGVLLGTPAYMSPEQARGEAIDYRSDLFSFGVVMYEMATGKLPFTGRSHPEMMSAVINQPHTPAVDLNKELPRAWSEVIDQALAKQPQDRYQRAEEIFQALKQTTASQDPVTAVTSGAITAGYMPRPPKVRTKWQHIIAAPPSPKVLLSLVAAPVLVTTLVFFLYLPRQRQLPAEPFQQVALKQLTTNGKANLAALSPDGKLFVYVSRIKGQERLLLGNVGGGEPVELRPAAEVTYRSLKFSSDGASVYYVVSGGAYPRGALFRLPAFGGVPEKLREGIDARIAFAPDMKQFVYARFDAETKSSSLVIADTNGTGERELVSRPDHLAFRSFSPSWSPDGKQIAAGAISEGNSGSYEVFVVTAADGQIKQLTTSAWNEILATCWLPDGRGLALVAREKDVRDSIQLWFVSYPEGVVRRILHDLDNYSSATVSLSADGQALLAIQAQRITNVWVAPTSDLNQAKQITFGSIGRRDGASNLDWSPDGKLLFGAMVSDSLTIWMMDADGDNQKQLTSAGYVDAGLNVTEDGRYMVFHSNRSGEWEIWRVRLDGSDLRQLTTGGQNSAPTLTPDGQWVFYTSSRDGLQTVWRISIAGGEPVRFTDKLLSWPRVSPDGKLLACRYQVDGKTKLAILPIAGEAPIKLFDFPRGTNLNLGFRWMPDGKAVTYRDSINGVWRQALEGGEPRRLEGLPEEKLYTYVWSKDGKKFAFVRDAGISDVVLIKDVR